MKPGVAAIAAVLSMSFSVSIGCGGRQDTGGMSARIRQLETEVAALRADQATQAAVAADAAVLAASSREKKRRPPEPRVPDLSREVADLTHRLDKLQVSHDQAWTELERIMFGDVRAQDLKWQTRVQLAPDVRYAVPVSRDNPSEGDPDAKVTWVIGFETAEPYTRRLLDAVRQVRSAYGRDLRIVYKHNVVHDHGIATAMALCAANRQGKFTDALAAVLEIPLTDRLEMRLPGVRGRLRAIDRRAFEADLVGACKRIVRDDHAFAAPFGLSATPYSFVNGRYVGGAQSADAFRRLIDEELAKADAELAGASPKGYYERLVRRGAKPPPPAPPLRPTP